MSNRRAIEIARYKDRKNKVSVAGINSSICSCNGCVPVVAMFTTHSVHFLRGHVIPCGLAKNIQQIDEDNNGVQ